jgi:hypothetical protein
MKQLRFFSTIFILLKITSQISAQVSTPFNFGGPADYVGWNAAQNFPLTIAHRRTITPQPINFLTANVQRMTILGNGNVGINIVAPTTRLDVNGLVRVRNLPFAPSVGIVTHTNNGILQSLPFNGNANQFLNGTGQFVTLPNAIGANNGTSIIGGNVQLGGNCNNAAAASLTNNREIPLAGFNIIFSGNGRVGMGNIATLCTPANTVEIAQGTTPSGLRFTNLNANSPQSPANGTALTLDINGDVILVPATAGAGNTTICGGANIDFIVKSFGGTSICTTSRIYEQPGTFFTGLNTTNPNFQLEVDNDINLTNSIQNQGYRIGGIVVLQRAGSRNTFVGPLAGISNTTGSNNTLTGFEAGRANTIGLNNSFYGSSAGRNNNFGNYNSFFGNAAGFLNTQGNFNTFMGDSCGYNNTTGSQNSFYGQQSGLLNVIGSFNAFFGDLSGERNIGSRNTFLGHHAGANNTSGVDNCYVGCHSAFNNNNSIGKQNNFIGSDCGPSEIQGDDNEFMGYRSGFANSTGNRNILIGSFSGFTQNSNDNVFIGYLSGYYETIGTNNTYLGTNSGNDPSAVNLTNAAAIGANAIARANDDMILGDINVQVGIGLSNAPTGPGNKLEIDAGINGTAPTPPGAVGASGLRLRDLRSNTLPIANPGAGVLAVALNGDVIYVPQTGGGGTNNIQACGSNIAPLLQNSEIALGGMNFVFTGNNAGSAINNVGIGTICSPTAKLDVLQNSGSTGSTGVYIENNDNSGNGITGLGTNVIGIRSKVTSVAGTTDRPIAGYFEAAAGPTPSYAIYVPINGGAVSIGHPVPTVNIGNTLLDVLGDIYSNNNIVVSDSRYKTNIVSINRDSALAKIRALNGVYYDWDIVNNPNHNFETGRQVGFIAQQVSPVLPEVVSTGLNGYYGLQYEKITALLVNAMQQLDSLVNVNKHTTDSLRQRIEQCCQKNNSGGSNGNGNGTGGNSGNGNGGGTNGNGNEHTINGKPNNDNVNQLEVQLVNSSAIILNQNVPNPFAEKTVITYFIPDNVNQAQLLFYNDLGEVLKTVEIKEKGKGQLTVYASNLSSGTYTYTLLADGNVVDTKKMVCTK